MTKREADKRFKDIWKYYLQDNPHIRSDDKVAKRTLWNDWTDMLAKEGSITEHQYDTWSGPSGLEGVDEGNKDDARELELFITSDADLYRQMHLPIIKNLITKKARGVYDHEKAKKGFMHLADEGAKRYAKEFGSRDAVWHEMFNITTRRMVAAELVETFETEAKLGNYDNLLPKKYQKN